MTFQSWEELVHEPASERHIVQLYREPIFLQKAVAAWLAQPLATGGGAVVVGTPENASRVLARLRTMGVDVETLQAAGRLRIVDAEGLMARFIVDGTPDAARFKEAAAEVLQAVRAACGPEGEVRAWGEMVNLLWKRGNLAAAQRLESLWNEVIDEHGIRLLCSYEADNLAPETHAGLLGHLCAGHSQLIPEDDFATFDLALGNALVDVFGEDEAAMVRTIFGKRRSLPIGMPPAEAVLVALQDVQPEVGKRVLAATRGHLRRGD
jgi:hypothetical protein